ncbi:MAG TPA: signal peptide peptidase SppA [Candidatus Aenigmarchaeota archaeon]|nr:signal peptide peptidase SppA [Candidatus Aenigmarchaeota archaeon]
MKKYRERRQWKFMLLGFIIGIIATCIIIFLNIITFSMEKIAVIDISGVIASRPLLFEDTTTPDDIMPLLERVNKDFTIKGVLFRINSPGGSVVPSRAIARMVKDVKKPKVCWLDDIATSGAYWIASGCDKIIADPLTITGSIGVSASYLEFSRLFEKYGIKYERIVSGEKKDIGSPYRNITTEERMKMEYIVREIFNYFLSDIARNRHLSAEQVEKIKDGSIFLGKDALEIGLVDMVGSYEDAKEVARDISNAHAASFIELKKKEFSLFDFLKR